MSKNILISLIGAEPTGNYRAYKEFGPSLLIHVYSKKTKEISDRILTLVDKEKTQIIEVLVEGDNYYENLQKLNELPITLSMDHFMNINVTGGTKIMSLAAVDFGKLSQEKCNVSFLYTEIESQKIHWFYENRSETFCDDLKLEEYIALAGQKIKSKENYIELKNRFYNSLEEIHDVLKDSYKRNNFQDFLSSFVREVAKKKENIIYKQKKIVNFYTECTEKIQKKGFRIEWTDSLFRVYLKEEIYLDLEQSIDEIDWFIFNTGWFELITAEKLAKKNPKNDIYMNVKFPLLKKIELDKNEVDILIVENGKLIFVECKSGIVFPNEINTMKVRQETYGGIGAKNLLVTRFDLAEGKNDSDKIVIEKCKDLKIEVKSYNSL